MLIIKKVAIGLSLTVLAIPSFGQETDFRNKNFSFSNDSNNGISLLKEEKSFFSESVMDKIEIDSELQIVDNSENKGYDLVSYSPIKLNQPKLNFGNSGDEKAPFLKNRRNLYSSLWAFASLNYLYADLVGLMDANVLAQYQSGVVNGAKITPTFLTVAAGFMQIPIANVFLPHIIKNEKTLRWVQIASGTVMTLVQTGTLFVGKPTPYYALFSAFEIAATSFITIDAIRWKPDSKKKRQLID